LRAAIGVEDVPKAWRYLHQRDYDEDPERHLVATIVIVETIREDPIQHECSPWRAVEQSFMRRVLARNLTLEFSRRRRRSTGTTD